jgi:hypothetical protein
MAVVQFNTEQQIQHNAGYQAGTLRYFCRILAVQAINFFSTIKAWLGLW